MNPRAQVSLLPDGRRLHLHDGPIDLIIEAFGAPSQVAKAYSAATERFTIILDELCAELPLLRQTAGLSGPPVTGVVAKRMLEAVLPYAADNFITPMAAVAGSVAAATVVANAVDLPGHPAISRVPACELAPDSDLGDLLVTQNVAQLSQAEVEIALHGGVAMARSLVERGLIIAAALNLEGETRAVGSIP